MGKQIFLAGRYATLAGTKSHLVGKQIFLAGRNANSAEKRFSGVITGGVGEKANGPKIFRAFTFTLER